MTKVVKLPLLDGGHVWVNPRRFLTVTALAHDSSAIQMNIPALKFTLDMPAHAVAVLLEEAQ